MKATSAALGKFLFSCELTACLYNREWLGRGGGNRMHKLRGAFLINIRLKRGGECNTKEPGLKRKCRNMEKKIIVDV